MSDGKEVKDDDDYDYVAELLEAIEEHEETIARQAKVIEKLKLQRGAILHERYVGFPLLAMNAESDLNKELEAIEQGRQAMNPDNPNFRTPEEEARAAELVRLKAEVARQARVIEKLKRYTQHRVDCICRTGVFQYSNDCDCGLKAIEHGEGT